MTAIASVKGDNNYLIQDSTINANTVVLGATAPSMAAVLSDVGAYDQIQKMFSDMLSVVNYKHPLFPEFGVKYSDELKRLISVPKTSDAYEKYPMRIQGTFTFRKEDFQGIGEQESPWEYAYRTQTTITLDTKSFQEYLGDIPNPYPTMTYSDGMKTSISPPEFPPAVEVQIQSGNVIIPVLLRRSPCKEYGVVKFENTSKGHGFNISIEQNELPNASKFNITKTHDGCLEALLQRERLILQMQETGQLTIYIGGKTLLECKISDKQFHQDFYTAAGYLEKYYSYLADIQKTTGCQFQLDLEGDFDSYFRTAFLLKNSLNNRWIRLDIDFDDQIRCDYANIPEEILSSAAENSDNLHYVQKNIDINLHGCHFTATQLHVIYSGGRINNVKAIYKHIRKKKSGILVTIRPQKGAETFQKHMLLSEVTYIPSGTAQP